MKSLHLSSHHAAPSLPWLLWFCTLITLPLPAQAAALALTGHPWPRHIIDASSQGADGIRVADINHDGLPDLATGWEEGGQVVVYLHPGHTQAKTPWPKVIVGRVASPEDAVFADINRDGRLDVVSSCEGRTRSVFVHLAPASEVDLLRGAQWSTAPFPALRNQAMWMFCLPMEVDNIHGPDLVLGAKGQGAELGWLQAPANPSRLEDWRWHPLANAGWIMSLRSRDMDGDGDLDVLFSDRRGPGRGVWWLEHPALHERHDQPWNKHYVGARQREVMFLDTGDVDGDGLEDVVAAIREGDFLFARRLDASGTLWKEERVALPDGIGAGKAVAIGDLNLDKKADLVITCGLAKNVAGVFALFRSDSGPESWRAETISGSREGSKFDRIELLDLDDDGDLDVVTCEEADNLGVIWYENSVHGRN